MQTVPPFAKRDITSLAYIISRLLSFPFWGIFYLLPIILYRDLQATPLQVTTMIVLKPLVSLFSPYWSQRVHAMRHRLISNLFWGNIIKFAPFLFFPFISNPWYYIAAFGLHMVLCRGTIPAWMEVLKIKIAPNDRSRICALGSTIDYLGVAILPIVFGGVLDHVAQSWRWLFPLSAFLGIISAWPIKKIKIEATNIEEPISKRDSLSSYLIRPWKSGWKILKERKDFARFQWGFFLGGAGLMIIQPIFPKYFTDILHLSYSDLLTAMAALKGIGFALSTPLWIRFFNRSRIFVLCSVVTLSASLFPLLMIFAKGSSSIIYLAYLLYGVMQGGSELSWKMSGPFFSKDSDSAPYSSVNILAVGIRGLIFPYLGAFIFLQTGSFTAVLLVSMILCLFATASLSFYGKRYPIRLGVNE